MKTGFQLLPKRTCGNYTVGFDGKGRGLPDPAVKEMAPLRQRLGIRCIAQGTHQVQEGLALIPQEGQRFGIVEPVLLVTDQDPGLGGSDLHRMQIDRTGEEQMFMPVAGNQQIAVQPGQAAAFQGFGFGLLVRQGRPYRNILLGRHRRFNDPEANLINDTGLFLRAYCRYKKQ
ncbi:MAG: hypothetical protein BWY71_01812 [Planctomycetes bacterium ADurb.Bin412]|nr:MAG: hypothetical protein BWY71_01812 [Planctomycetes bacterium ADurb.Bin412]